MTQANCLNKAPNKRLNPEAKDLWFPAKGESANPGKIFCFTCPVREACEEYAIRTRSVGMWAGVIRNGKEDDDGDPDET